MVITEEPSNFHIRHTRTTSAHENKVQSVSSGMGASVDFLRPTQFANQLIERTGLVVLEVVDVDVEVANNHRVLCHPRVRFQKQTKFRQEQGEWTLRSFRWPVDNKESAVLCGRLYQYVDQLE